MSREREVESEPSATAQTRPLSKPAKTLSLGLPSLEAPELGALDEFALEDRERRLLAKMFGVAREPARVGRYVILDELGRGGMGIVHAAYDQDLNRKIALKTLNMSGSRNARRRFMREAQAMARLSHPNIVQVHEVGSQDERVYIAMEFIPGETLGAWARATPEPRPWRELLAMLIQAGRGLEAAHRVSLVHRDFKPDNVIVGEDGRARVLDFGLVRGLEEISEASTEPEMSQVEDFLATELTVQGAVMGTPIYMAPEQHAGRSSGPLADQFAFCATCFELLFDLRPFDGQTMAALYEAKRSSQIADIRHKHDVPASVCAAIVRGLSAEPERRWPEMSALLDELAGALETGRRPWRIATVAGAAALGTAAVFALATPSAPPVCEFDESALAGVWDQDALSALHRAFASRGLSTATQSIAAIDARLSNWGERWLSSQRRSCEATRVQGSQSETMLDLRSSCLERQRQEAAAITKLLTNPDGSGVGHAFELLDGLPAVDICDSPRLAETSHPLPVAAAQREVINAAFSDISRAEGLAHLDQLDAAKALASTLEDEAARLDYLPLTLQVELLRAKLELFGRDAFDEGVVLLRGVIREAERAGLDQLAADARVFLASLVVGTWGALEAQELMLEEAETAMLELAHPNDRRAFELEYARAKWLHANGDYDGALAGYRASLARARETANLEQQGVTLRRIAHLEFELGRLDDAERGYRESQAVYEQARGPTSSVNATLELQLGMLELERGRLDAAEAHFRGARELFTLLFEPDTNDFATLELVEAKLALVRGDFEGAARGFTRVTEIERNDVRRGEAWDALGVVRFYQGDFVGSLDAYWRARTHLQAALGPEHPRLGSLDSNIGESLAATGDHERAQEFFSTALELLEGVLPPDHPDLALPYKGRGQSRLALGDVEGARADLERALSLHRQHPGEPLELPDVEFSLARALARSGDVTRARELAEQAREHFLDLGQDDRGSLVSEWLRETY